MNTLNILEVNNIDLVGNRFNGYNMIKELSDHSFNIKQAVIIKKSENPFVSRILNTDLLIDYYYKLQSIEDKLSIHNIFSITTPALFNLQEYKSADIVHFHMFHNTKLSIYSLIEIAKEKRLIISLHDPWFLTGRCVHFYDCYKWKEGCNNCNNLDTLFQFNKDNSNIMWKIKKYVFEHIECDIIVPSKWMFDLVKQSPFILKQHNVHLVPFGIDSKQFEGITSKQAKKHYNIPIDNTVLFLRAQNEFKGTTYVLEALKKMHSEKKISILTCDEKGLLNDINDKYDIIDLGIIDDNEMKFAMNACDVFVMPSKGEAFGLMAIEAMCCSKPVIAFNNTALPYVTNALECGYLVNDKDSDDLMEKLKLSIENDVERKRKGKLARIFFEKEYNINKYNNNLKQIYSDSIKRKKTKDYFEIFEKIDDSKLETLLNKISKRKRIRDEYNVDYSNPFVLKRISEFNKILYNSIINETIINNKKWIFNKYKIKLFIKKNPKLYKLLKKILRR